MKLLNKNKLSPFYKYPIIPILFSALVGAVLVYAAWRYFYFPFCVGRHPLWTQEICDAINKNLWLPVAGIAAVPSLWLTWYWRKKAKDSEIHANRFTMAIEHLGHERIAVRLGGIYELKSLAGYSKPDRSVIVETLSSYIRYKLPSIKEEEYEKSDIGGVQQRVPTDVDSALQVLAQLGGLRAEKHLFGRVHLYNCNLRMARLNGANLREADLRCVDLTGADLSGANLCYAKLVDADLSGANLYRSYLNGAKLISANMKGANLVGVVLENANMMRADLSGADLSLTCICGTDLRAINLRKANLKDALYDSKTLFPKNFSPHDFGLRHENETDDEEKQ